MLDWSLAVSLGDEPQNPTLHSCQRWPTWNCGIVSTGSLLDPMTIWGARASSTPQHTNRIQEDKLVKRTITREKVLDSKDNQPGKLVLYMCSWMVCRISRNSVTTKRETCNRHYRRKDDHWPILSFGRCSSEVLSRTEEIKSTILLLETGGEIKIIVTITGMMYDDRRHCWSWLIVSIAQDGRWEVGSLDHSWRRTMFN